MHKNTLWLSEPDPLEKRVKSTLLQLQNGDHYTSDLEVAVELAKKGYSVKRRDKDPNSKDYTTTSFNSEELSIAIEDHIELRGDATINRPSVFQTFLHEQSKTKSMDTIRENLQLFILENFGIAKQLVQNDSLEKMGLDSLDVELLKLELEDNEDYNSPRFSQLDIELSDTVEDIVRKIV